MAARQKSFQVLAILLGICAPLAVGEGYLRFTGTGGGFYQPDPILGAWHIPGRSGRWRSACFDVRIQINSQGLRDVEHPLEKPPGVRRIAVLGDSIVEALQVPVTESFPRRLEALLNADAAGPPTEVINLGMSGFGTDQMYLALKTVAARYRPDLVVLTFTVGNDVRNNHPRLEGRVSTYPKPFFRLEDDGRLVPIPFDAPAAPAAGILERLKAGLRYFRLYDFLVQWVRANPWVASALARAGLIRGVPAEPPGDAGGAGPGGGPGPGQTDWGVYLRESSGEWAEAWRVTEALILATRDEAKRLGAGFLLVSIPTALEMASPEDAVRTFPDLRSGHYDLAAPRDRLRRLAASEGIGYVSAFDVLAGDLRARDGALDDYFFWCDGHLTARAHGVVARAIAEAIRGGVPGASWPDPERGGHAPPGPPEAR